MLLSQCFNTNSPPAHTVGNKILKFGSVDFQKIFYNKKYPLFPFNAFFDIQQKIRFPPNLQFFLVQELMYDKKYISILFLFYFFVVVKTRPQNPDATLQFFIYRPQHWGIPCYFPSICQWPTRMAEDTLVRYDRREWIKSVFSGC